LATVGFTGPPGAGKSTLIEQVGLALVHQGERVAVLAVDPTSPFTGGALLGDRLRMPRLLEAGAFVRSVATRGSMGGLSTACGAFLRLLQAAPFTWVLLETIGVGQDEVDVAAEVDTVVLLQVPGLGDDLQLAKAGIMEIAHVFVVNKKDRPGAQELAQHLQAQLAQAPPGPWLPPVLQVAATTGEGVEELVGALRKHQEYLGQNARRQELARKRVERQLRALVGELLQARLKASEEVWEREVGAVLAGQRDLLAAAENLVQYLGGQKW
jgi:LAO/AO transport system kinase